MSEEGEAAAVIACHFASEERNNHHLGRFEGDSGGEFKVELRGGGGKDRGGVKWA